mmetsp:Transcript_70/g.74  ORF Transcript_70/g.74 Transcript_70/m.74 type:complete len:188 (-) Transcript_70:54-617(-)
MYFILAVSVTSLAIPFGLLDMLNILIFPFPISVIIMFVEKTIGTALVYIITKYLVGKNKEEYLEIEVIKRVNKVIRKSPIYYGTLVKFASIPASVKNYGLAALEISFRDYMICSLIGSLVFIPLKTYVNYQMIEMFDSIRQGEPVLPSANLLIALISLLSFGVIIKKMLGATEENDSTQVEIKEKVE